MERSPEPCCLPCLVASAGISHGTSVIRQLTDAGWVVEQSYQKCLTCGRKTSHRAIVGTAARNERAKIAPKLRAAYLARRGHCDAFSGLPSAKLELDHREPHARRRSTEEPVTADNIADRYQPLTPANNQLKRRACEQCLASGIRPAFSGLRYWIEGGPERPESCAQCPYAFPERWRDAAHRYLCPDDPQLELFDADAVPALTVV